jgi:hypothetical protein
MKYFKNRNVVEVCSILHIPFLDKEEQERWDQLVLTDAAFHLI